MSLRTWFLSAVAGILLAGWAGAVCAEIPRPEHPRPDFRRTEWQNLNGIWEFAFDASDSGIKERWFAPDTAPFPLRIVVPFPWESRLSGIERPDYKGAAWYRRTFTVPKRWEGKRIWLCFGAVDWSAAVWLNGEKLGEHEGGYSEFRFDISGRVRFERPNLLVVRVRDLTDHETPIGKQTPSWYTSTSGIWQTVWLEATGQVCAEKLRILPLAGFGHVPTGKVRFELSLNWGGGPGANSGGAVVEVRSPNRRFPAVSAKVPAGRERVSLTVQVPNPKFWAPDAPVLYPAEIAVYPARPQPGFAPDLVRTYFGIRTVAWGRYAGSQHSFVLFNGRPVYLCGALDQSFNPDGIYTAPSDEFLRRDIELAKAAGFNMLRIHIKADEPRKLYWADKLGILIQCDIPCHYRISERARRNFEQTMRRQIERDFNHPSIYAWTVFNEEWGIGNLRSAPREHRVDWVEQMWRLAKRLDPTRLVQDNTGWSHLITDLNSFHWYGRSVDGFRQEYRAISKNRIRPGDDWNYIAGRKQRGEPFVNNEFGYVSAGDGDGDWSWGVLCLVNAMRACGSLVGYTYTELTDIEWEHNGVYNYDRTPKRFGYEFWAPGMSLRDVFAEDFLVLDVPAVKYAKPGEAVRVPAVFSHFSGRHESGLVLKWRMRWLDRFGNLREGPVQSRPCSKTPPYRLTSLGDIQVALPKEPALATLCAWLEDAGGRRVHTNYTQWLVQSGRGLPSAEAVDRHTLVLRFRPEEWAVSRFSEQDMPEVPIEGKQYGRGHGFMEYRLKLPDGVDLAGLQTFSLLCEVAAKAGREKVDWEHRVNRQDYPQTDAKRFPTTVAVSVNGVHIATWHLPDDPADARGVLSHWRGTERGSYGYLMHAEVQMGTPEGTAILNRWRENKQLVIRFEVPWNAVHRGGLAVYGEQMGRYPLDPTVILRFTAPLGIPAGWNSGEPVAVNTHQERLQFVLPTAARGGHNWRYTTERPPEDWIRPEFDDSAWRIGRSGFGQHGTPGAVVGTEWTSSNIWMRTKINLPDLPTDTAGWLEVHHDEDCEIFVNGELLWRERGFLTAYKKLRLAPNQLRLFRPGENVIAVHCRQTAGGQFIDVGLAFLPR